MARRPFGGQPDCVVVDTTGTPIPAAQVRAYTAKTGGSQVTDLTQADGTTPWAGGVIVADSYGLLTWYGPADGTNELWLDAGLGERLLVESHDLDSRVASNESTITTLSGTVTALNSSKGQPNGLATLDGTGKVPSSQLTSSAVASVDGLTGAVDLTSKYLTQTNAANTYAPLNSTPSLEEIIHSWTNWGYSGTTASSILVDINDNTQLDTIMVAEFALQIISARIVFARSGSLITASDTNYWNISLSRYSAGTGASFVTATTKTAGGGGWGNISGFTGYSFAPFAWNTTNATFSPGDALAVGYSKSGAPSQKMITPHTISYRYVPV